MQVRFPFSKEERNEKEDHENWDPCHHMVNGIVNDHLIDRPIYLKKDAFRRLFFTLGEVEGFVEGIDSLFVAWPCLIEIGFVLL